MTGPFTALVAYFLGSIPFGYLIVRWQRGIDVRTTGSGSIGATNVMRNLGIAGFAITFLLDFGKGIASVLIASRLTSANPVWVAAAAVGTIVGHCFPVWLKFRGGKGVATAVGVFLVLAPREVGIALLLFAVIVAVTRYISLGSIIATGAFPVLLYFIDHPPAPIVAGAAFGAAIIITRHSANIGRLLRGVENRVGKRKGAGSRE